jgi:sec-independent protein translocase protein TatA
LRTCAADHVRPRHFLWWKDLDSMGFGVGEIVLVLALVVLFFGAKRIPQIARGVGEGIRNFKRGVREEESADAELKEGENEDRRLPGDPTS